MFEQYRDCRHDPFGCLCEDFLRHFLPAKVVKVDDHTVDFILTSPNPILNSQWDTWYIVSKKWAEANNAVAPTPAAATSPSFASLNANGTGAFTIESHQPGVKTVFKANPNWWQKPQHNLKEIVFTPIGSDATRVAALLSGEVDIIEPVPIQDISRVDSSPNAEVMKGPELRTIFLGMDQVRDELLYSNVKGKNPFKDIKVREAFYKAIDIELIKTRVMRGLSTPSALMIAPQLFPLSKDFTRPKFDPDGAKKLLTEAGYPDGFEVTMDCPNDRYVNDAAICQAVVGMLARIGIKVTLLAQPKALGVASGLLAAMGAIPGMPNIAFLLMAGLCAGGAWWLTKRRREQTLRAITDPAAPPGAPAAPLFPLCPIGSGLGTAREPE